jgi:hypothetical protein
MADIRWLIQSVNDISTGKLTLIQSLGPRTLM